MTPTTDLKAALLEANGKTLDFKGRKYRLQSSERMGKFYPYPVFEADALHLNPQTDEERKFCYWDLWKSENDESAELLFKFAALGGYKPKTTL